MIHRHARELSVADLFKTGCIAEAIRRDESPLPQNQMRSSRKLVANREMNNRCKLMRSVTRRGSSHFTIPSFRRYRLVRRLPRSLARSSLNNSRENERTAGRINVSLCRTSMAGVQPYFRSLRQEEHGARQHDIVAASSTCRLRGNRNVDCCDHSLSSGETL